MADRCPKTGLFLPGNKAPKKRKIPSHILKAMKENRIEIFNWISKVGSQSLQETQALLEKEKVGKLTNIQATAIKFWAELRENPNTALYSMLFSIHGFSVDSIKELVDDMEGSEDADTLELTTADKLEMIEKFKKTLMQEEKSKPKELNEPSDN